tara:strand:+ start:351 stop:680 length:330 start_codon:yes stop_codon:yes gene_type:complete
MVLGLVHVNDVDTDFQILVEETNVSGVNVVFDLSSASALQMVFTDPNGTETTVTSTVLNGTGTDGIMRYINSTPSPIISTSGLWTYRARLTMGSGGLFQSNSATFEVLG